METHSGVGGGEGEGRVMMEEMFPKSRKPSH